MGWREDLRPASFRGVEFHVMSHEAEGLGRVGVLHEYPFGELPYFEDLGAASKTYSVQAYVIGYDYFEKRDALIAALRQAGAGQLVHPWLGTIHVNATDVRLSESNREGGMARFSLSFVQTGANINPTQTQDSALVMGSAALAARQALEAAFADSYAGAAVPDFVRQGALQDMTAISREVSANIAAAPLLRNSLGPALSEAQNDITSLNTAALRDSDTTFRAITGLYDAISENIITLSGNARRQGIRSLTSLSDVTVYAASLSTALPNATASRQFQADNREVLVLAARVSAILAAVSLVPNVPYQSRDDAETARKNLILSLETLADDAAAKGWDDSWRQLNDLRVLVNRDLGRRAGALPRLVTLNRPRPISSTLLAWQLYGASPDRVIDKAADLTARNKAKHPSFLNPQNLEALIDD